MFKRVFYAFSMIALIIIVLSFASAANIRAFSEADQYDALELITQPYDITWGEPAPKPRFKIGGVEMKEGVDFDGYYYSSEEANSYSTADYTSFYTSGRFNISIHLTNSEACKLIPFPNYSTYIVLAVFNVKPAKMADCSYDPVSDVVWDFKEHANSIIPEVTPRLTNVKYKGISIGGVTYSYENNRDAGTAYIKAKTYNSALEGELVVPFKILPADMSKLDIKHEFNGTFVYTGSAITPDKYSNRYYLVCDGCYVNPSSYTVEYVNNIKAGTATMKITGKNLLKGTCQTTFKIEKASVKNMDPDVRDLTYTGAIQKPKVSLYYSGTLYGNLVENQDYTLEYTPQSACGEYQVTYKGKGNFKDSVTTTYKIEPCHIGYADSTDQKIEYADDLDSSKVLKPVLKLSGYNLVNGKDFTVTSVDSNKNVGRHTANVQGKGSFTGTATIYFYIVAADFSKYTTSADDYIYDGYTYSRKPKIYLYDKKGNLQTKYDIKYENDDVSVGTHKYTLTPYSNDSNHTGSITGTYKIVPRDISDSTLYGLYPQEKDIPNQRPVPQVSLDNCVSPSYGKDYTVSYSLDPVKAIMTVTVKGIGNFTGIKTGSYKCGEPQAAPTVVVTPITTPIPTSEPTAGPTSGPTSVPTSVPTTVPTSVPTGVPTSVPTGTVSATPVVKPSAAPTAVVTTKVTVTPTAKVTAAVTAGPTAKVTAEVTAKPTAKVTAEVTPEVTQEVTPEVTPEVTSEVTPEPTTTEPEITPSADPKVRIMDFVKRIYLYVLDREPEEEGAAFWTDELYSFRRTGAEVGLGFIFSDEFTGRGLSDEEFVTVLYNTFFDREPEEGGFAFWTGALKDGTLDRKAVANGFIYSQEWADTCAEYGIRSGGEIKPGFEIAPTDATYAFVERMYTTAMDRESDPSGRDFWANELSNFRFSGEQVGLMFFLSEEMQGYNLSDEEFVTRLYKTFMDREPEEGGFKFWVGYLGDGGSREGAVYGFTRSEEFVNKCIEARILPY